VKLEASLSVQNTPNVEDDLCPICSRKIADHSDEQLDSCVQLEAENLKKSLSRGDTAAPEKTEDATAAAESTSDNKTDDDKRFEELMKLSAKILQGSLRPNDVSKGGVQRASGGARADASSHSTAAIPQNRNDHTARPRTAASATSRSSNGSVGGVGDSDESGLSPSAGGGATDEKLNYHVADIGSKLEVFNSR